MRNTHPDTNNTTHKKEKQPSQKMFRNNALKKSDNFHPPSQNESKTPAAYSIKARLQSRFQW